MQRALARVGARPVRPGPPPDATTRHAQAQHMACRIEEHTVPRTMVVSSRRSARAAATRSPMLRGCLLAALLSATTGGCAAAINVSSHRSPDQDWSGYRS